MKAKQAAIVVALTMSVLIVMNIEPASTSAAGQRTLWNYSGQQSATKYYAPVERYARTSNDGQPNSYTSTGYSTGSWYVRVQVSGKPSNIEVVGALCLWQTKNGKRYAAETCASNKAFVFSRNGTMWARFDNPSSWWNKRNGQLDWSKPFDAGRIMLFDGRPQTADGKYLLMSRLCGDYCYRGGPGYGPLSDHVPISLSSRIEMVPRGQNFTAPAEWRSTCPAAWGGGCSGPNDFWPTTSGGGSTTGGSSTTTGGTSTTGGSSTTTGGSSTTTGGSSTTTGGSSTSTGGTEPGPASCTSSSATGTNQQPRPSVLAGDSQLQVVWPPVDRSRLFQVRWRNERTGELRFTAPSPSRNVVVDSLENGDCYQVSVRAYLDGSWRPWASVFASPAPSNSAAGAQPSGQSGSQSDPTPEEPRAEAQPACQTRFKHSGGSPSVAAESGTDFIKLTSIPVPSASLYQVRVRDLSTGERQWVFSESATIVLQDLPEQSCFSIGIRARVGSSWQAWRVGKAPTA